MIAELWLVHPAPAMVDAFDERFAGLPNVHIRQQHFEELPPHDCFVTAGNAYGIMTAGIDAAVVQRFGLSFMQAVQQRILNDYFGEQPIGTAFVQPTYERTLPFIIHAPTMRVPGSITGTDNIYRATWAAFLALHAYNQQAEERLEVVAFPAMGTGFGGVPAREAARQMAVAYRHFLEPPHRLDWDVVVQRHKAICYDGTTQVVHTGGG